MRLSAFTIVLDGMPWIQHHYEALAATNLDWRWVIVEGVARPTKDTAWVKAIPPRLSLDGTSEYLRSIKDSRVRVIQKPRWENKTSMCNEALGWCEPGVLMQIDSDELWTSKNLENVHNIFEQDWSVGSMRFYCRYFVGGNIVTAGNDCYGNNPQEWLRAWRFRRGQRFATHEPPSLAPGAGRCMSRDETNLYKISFDHMAYATEKQVAFKEEYYKYPGAVDGWRRLQKNDIWPVKLKDFLPWVDDKATATRLFW
jgi:hypothetical protein